MQGRSEEILGAWLRRQPRGRGAFIVATKVAGPGGMDWLRGGPAKLDGANITAALDASLTRLGTDYVDLLQLHWPDRCTAPAPVRNPPRQWREQSGSHTRQPLLSLGAAAPDAESDLHPAAAFAENSGTGPKEVGLDPANVGTGPVPCLQRLALGLCPLFITPSTCELEIMMRRTGAGTSRCLETWTTIHPWPTQPAASRSSWARWRRR